MGAPLLKPIEQVALEHLIGNAYETFEKSLLSISGRVVLWGSFTDEKQLAERYFSSKGKTNLLDRRRKLSEADLRFKEEIEYAANEALDYVKWVRARSGQPILQESLVTYCAAFENCLKIIAVAFLLAEGGPRGGLRKQIYVPGPELKRARAAVDKAWGNSLNNEIPRVQFFFEREIRNKNPDESRFEFPEVSAANWSICGSAFKLRNAILHSMGRLSEQIELGEEIFHPGWDVELSARSLRVTKDAFGTVLWPFGPYADL